MNSVVAADGGTAAQPVMGDEDIWLGGDACVGSSRICRLLRALQICPFESTVLGRATC